MVQKIIGAQRDFSYGEVDPALKRADDHPARKAGLRQMANARILNSGSIQDRPGRRALYPVTNGGVSQVIRTERISLVAGTPIDIQFLPGRVKIINAAGVTVANFTAQGNGALLPWVSSADVASIVYAISKKTITICFGNAMRPQVITFDGVSTYTIADYTELVTAGGQKRTPFYRLSPQGVTMLPSAAAGNITVKFSSPIVVAGMVGTRVRFAGRQILLGSVIDSSTMNATVIEPLPIAETIALSSSAGRFNLGDVVIGSITGATGIVCQAPNIQYVSIPIPFVFALGDTVTGGTSGATGVITARSPDFLQYGIVLNTGTLFLAFETISGASGSSALTTVSGTSLVVQLLATNNTSPAYTIESIVGPSGAGSISGATTAAPQAIAVWDDEVFNSFRGYPASCFADQFRVGFCNFPALPGGVLWSAINSATDLFANDASSPDNAIFEIAPNNAQVYYVIPGPEGSEFVFCDNRVFYIPISETNPLKPGSVAFKTLSADGAGQVQPRLAQEAILYANAGRSSIMAILATGAYLRPFNTKNLTEFHAHLFSGIMAIACPSADGTFNERYAYVLNGNGSISVGKYDAGSLASSDTPQIGWGPWSGAGIVSWIGAYAADVLFTSTYFGAALVEILDDAQYLDCGITVNAAPAAFAPPGGKGPLWFIPSRTVSLIDQTSRVMGTYQIDGNGFIVPQFNGGEDLTRADLVAGQPWTMIAEPFCPDAPPGTSAGQRMFKRRVSRFAAYVIHSTGFMMARLFSGPVTPTSPALGAVMNFTRFATWNQGDDPTKPPPQREITERTRPIGRSFDPRVAVIKDVPGPLQIVELGLEATI